MDTRKLSDALSVAPQLTGNDLAEVARLGFRTVINNRPDGESQGQPSAAELAAIAKQHGLAYHHQPVISGAMTEHDVIAFRQLLASAAQPVLAFCRSGTRCTTLWAFASAGELAADDIIGAAARAGYDLSGLRDRL
ncbi:MAG: TIGR01244 family phosphatase [Gammaproteobacteria bacterium]|nr:TIGR01244 family phosphatase [Gammaproteobacteria bacterium]MBP6052425.1 TIGR01244 family phosphatase [Pseudomonadales bacterium]MBK6583165.1 TIGR01244 family phosphatase [Gammaproteobacteria bacterium]MBK7729963.1 TIGR01244 family phosphatase [Gammaproteobacteria bacterium]MBK9666184.1 TIGR01244 family phosphatase [Gammaproteobacteria bacterium]